MSYFGQGALLLADPGPDGAVRAPFFLLVPSWGLIPLVVLATAATVIASQAVITGAFSVARQAVRLGYLPRLRIVHTSAQTVGQIYVPWVNWALMVMVIVLVLAFQSSAALAYAFGMAVTGTIIVTTLLLLYVARRQWAWPLWAVLLGGVVALGIEGLFLAANLTKLLHGAWLPLLIGRGHLHRDDHLAARPPGGHRAAREPRRAAARVHRRVARAAPVRFIGSPVPRSSSTGTRPPHRWPCGPTSSTTRCCTSAW